MTILLGNIVMDRQEALASTAVPAIHPDDAVHLDVVHASSQDDRFPASGLGSSAGGGGKRLQELLRPGGRSETDTALASPLLNEAWQSEKFCEYPQELVFLVNRGLATSIDKLLVLSHHTKISSRIEVLTGSEPMQLPHLPRSHWQHVRWRRLGVMNFLNSNKSDEPFSRELKIVPIPEDPPLQFIKLVLHSAHENTSNLFGQVGLLCVAAIASKNRNKPTIPYPSLHSNSHIKQEIDSIMCRARPSASSEAISSSPALKAALAPLKIKYAPTRDDSDPAVFLSSSSPSRTSSSLLTASQTPLQSVFAHSAPSLGNVNESHREIWLPQRGEYATPDQIVTRIQLGRETASLIVAGRGDEEEVLRVWRVDELEAQQLCEKLRRLDELETRGLGMVSTAEDRITLRAAIREITGALQALDEKVAVRLADMQRDAHSTLLKQLAKTPLRIAGGSTINDPGDVGVPSYFTEKRCLSREPWQTREEFLWKIVGKLKPGNGDSESGSSERMTLRRESTLDEALQITKAVLRDDNHAQVFVAACALLCVVLEQYSLFHEGSHWHHEVKALLLVLLHRLDDVQSLIRNNAAFAIIKIAELTRARGTFVMHTLLLAVESERVAAPVTAQIVYGLLKVFAALLHAFHCCATIDISAQRVLQFLMLVDAFQHENAHVRDAARQLVLVLQEDVGTDMIIAFFKRKKVPSDVWQPVALLLETADHRKRIHKTQPSHHETEGECTHGAVVGVSQKNDGDPKNAGADAPTTGNE